MWKIAVESRNLFVLSYLAMCALALSSGSSEVFTCMLSLFFCVTLSQATQGEVISIV